MKTIEQLTLTELKIYKELIETRINELRRHQIDDDYYPPYTEKEINEFKSLEMRTAKALSIVNKMIRQKLDSFIHQMEI